MPASATMTIRVAPEVKAKLDRLAQATRRSKSFLAGEALAAYAERELEIIAGVGRGLYDAKAGRLIPHEAAMAEIDAVLPAPGRKTAR